jgi:hypothetical protein
MNTNKPRKPPMRPMTITLVPSGFTSTPRQLGTPTIAQVHRRVTDRLAKAKVYLAVGVLEVSLAEHQEERYPPAWAWHLHGVAMTRNPEVLKRRLANAFPRSDTVPRPVRVTPWNGDAKWLRYCHKLDRRCRVGVDDEAHFDVRKQKPRTSRGTASRKLNSNELLELLLFHDRISLDSRIITKRAQLRSSGVGCRIVKMRRPRR